MGCEQLDFEWNSTVIFSKSTRFFLENPSHLCVFPQTWSPILRDPHIWNAGTYVKFFEKVSPLLFSVD